MTTTNVRRSSEFLMIQNEKALSTIFSNLISDANFLVIEIQKSAIKVNTGNAKNTKVCFV